MKFCIVVVFNKHAICIIILFFCQINCGSLTVEQLVRCKTNTESRMLYPRLLPSTLQHFGNNSSAQKTQPEMSGFILIQSEASKLLKRINWPEKTILKHFSLQCFVSWVSLLHSNFFLCFWIFWRNNYSLFQIFSLTNSPFIIFLCAYSSF